MFSRRTFLKHSSIAATVLATQRSLFSQPGRQLGTPLAELPYGAVQLTPGLAQQQFEQTQSVLLGMNVDSLLKPYRLRAGLPAPGPEMGGWYDEVPPQPTPSGGHGFAPGHAFGQWISAMARGYAVAGDPKMRAKAGAILALYELAISGRFYANFRFPAYTYDKMVCGLSDAHQYCSLDPGFGLLDRTTAAAEPHLPPQALDRDGPQRLWRESIGENSSNPYTWDEPYTLPENLFLAWQRGAGERYRTLGERFLLDKTYFDPLAENHNVLAGHHAYSYCNALSSAAECYLATGSEKHLRAAENGFRMIDETQSFATGGWGPNESFSAPDSDDMFRSLTGTHRGFETPCGSYAHFKLTRYLLRITADGRYGDSMERVFYNTVLGAKRLEADGQAFYYSDYNNSGKRVYFPDKWPCCSGTLPQVAADYHLLLYFHDAQGLYVNLYLPSTTRWTAPDGAAVTVSQEGEYPLEGTVRLRLGTNRATAFALRLRIPRWAQSTAAQTPEIRVNGARVPMQVRTGFATLDRTWHDGDQVELLLPLPVRLESIDSRHPGTAALLRGPLVLFALDQPTAPVPRAQLLNLRRSADSGWRAGNLRFATFTGVEEQPYRTYLDVL